MRAWSSYIRYASPFQVFDTRLTSLIQTETDDVPLSLLAFQGRLVAGIGKALRIYDIGKKKLLRKVENKVYFHAAMNGRS